MKFSFSLFKWRLRFSSYKVPSVRTLGVYDICEDGKHILFLDYDNFYFDWVVNEVSYLIKKYKLSSFYIFESSLNSYHAVCFDKLNLGELNKIVMESNCDTAFKQALIWDYGSRVLRVFPKGKINKPVFKSVIISKFNKKFKSSAHIKFFSNNYEVKINDKNGDSKEKVFIIDYPTKNKDGNCNR